MNEFSPTFKYFTRFKALLIDPRASIQDPLQRRQSRLLAVLLLAMLPVEIVTMAFLHGVGMLQSSQNIALMLVSIPIFLIAYGLSRLGEYRAAIWLMIGSISIGILVGAIPDSQMIEIELLDYLIIPVMLSCAFFSLRATMLVIMAELVGLAVFPHMVPPGMMDWQLFFDALGLNLVIWTGQVIFTRHRKQLERDRRTILAESEARFRELLEIVPLSITVSSNARRFVYANPAAVNFYGATSPDDLIDQSSIQFVLPEFASIVAERAQQLSQGQAVPPIEYPVRRLDNQIIHAETTSIPIIYQGESGWLSVNRDITESKRAENALRESEALYRTLAQNLPNTSVFLYDHDLRFLMVEGEAQLRDKGMAKELIIGKTLSEVLSAEDAEHAVGFYQAALAGEERTGEYTHGERIYHLHVIPVKDSQGNIFAGMAVSYDITEAKHAENALRESEARYRTLSDFSPVGILVADYDGKTLYCNSATAHLLGADSPQQIIEQNAHNFIFPEIYAVQQQRIQELREGKALEPLEYRYRRLDGGIIEGEVRSTQITYEGQPAILVIIQDITERKQAEQALRESEARYRTVADLSPMGIIVSTNEGIIIYCNRAAARMLGASEPEQIIGKQSRDFTLPESHPIQQKRREVLRTGQPVEPQEYLYRQLDGSLIEGEARATPIPYEGQLAVLSIIQDITERKRLEWQRLELALERERTGLLKRFIDEAAAHDLRTPLTIMRTSVYLLTKSTDPEHQQRHLQKLDDQVTILETMVENLLSMSQLYKPLSEFTLMNVNVNGIIRDVFMEQQAFAQHEGVTMELDLNPHLPLVYADENALVQAIRHLVKNALIYTPEGGHAQVRTQVYPDQQEIAVEVRDNGIGIPAEELSLIFEPFYKVDKSRRLGEGDMGIGLTFVRRIAEAHQGRVTVESTLGMGSVFTLWLPIADDV